MEKELRDLIESNEKKLNALEENGRILMQEAAVEGYTIVESNLMLMNANLNFLRAEIAALSTLLAIWCHHDIDETIVSNQNGDQ